MRSVLPIFNVLRELYNLFGSRRNYIQITGLKIRRTPTIPPEAILWIILPFKLKLYEYNSIAKLVELAFHLQILVSITMSPSLPIGMT